MIDVIEIDWTPSAIAVAHLNGRGGLTMAGPTFAIAHVERRGLDRMPVLCSSPGDDIWVSARTPGLTVAELAEVSKIVEQQAKLRAAIGKLPIEVFDEISRHALHEAGIHPPRSAAPTSSQDNPPPRDAGVGAGKSATPSERPTKSVPVAQSIGLTGSLTTWRNRRLPDAPAGCCFRVQEYRGVVCVALYEQGSEVDARLVGTSPWCQPAKLYEHAVRLVLEYQRAKIEMLEAELARAHETAGQALAERAAALVELAEVRAKHERVRRRVALVVGATLNED